MLWTAHFVLCCVKSLHCWRLCGVLWMNKSYHHTMYNIVDLKWQNRLKAGTDKPTLKVKMQSVSDDDVRKRLLEKHVLSQRWKVYSDWEDVTSSGRAYQVFGPATGKARLPMIYCLTSGTRGWLVPVEWSDRLPERLRTGTSDPWRTLNVSRVILYRLWVGTVENHGEKWFKNTAHFCENQAKSRHFI